MKCLGCGVIHVDCCYFVTKFCIDICPCMDCLVKAMCTQKSSCDLRNDAIVESRARDVRRMGVINE
jgi:hypothetical protein